MRSDLEQSVGESAPDLEGIWLGRVDYLTALALQQEYVSEVHEGKRPSTVLLLEHPSVYTLGKRGGREFILKSEKELHTMGAKVVQTDRGGLVTFHGPGQLVGYPIVHLKTCGLTMRTYVDRLLQALVNYLANLGIRAEIDMARPGVYVNGAKMAAVGVRSRRSVTYHGFALNLTTDLGWFSNIVACGLSGVKTTSVLEQLGDSETARGASRDVGADLSRELGLNWVFQDRESSSRSIECGGTGS